MGQDRKLIARYPHLQKERKKIQGIMESLRGLIELCGDDPGREGLQETPYRVVKAFLEYTEGYRENPADHLRKTFDVEHDELVLVKDIQFHSLCEHHFAPFFGLVHVGYIPKKKVTGLSKVARLVDGFARRFQVQERMTNQIADSIMETLDPQGVMVVVQGKHMCMCGRGIRKTSSSTITSAVRGVFREPAARQEFLELAGPFKGG